MYYGQQVVYTQPVYYTINISFCCFLVCCKSFRFSLVFQVDCMPLCLPLNHGVNLFVTHLVHWIPCLYYHTVDDTLSFERELCFCRCRRSLPFFGHFQYIGILNSSWFNLLFEHVAQGHDPSRFFHAKRV